MFARVSPPEIPSELLWSFRQVKPGDRVDVRWVGPVHGLETHHAGTTKPCRAALTGGALQCSLCDTRIPRRWRGYAPAIEFRGTKVVFLVGIEAGRQLDQVEAGKVLSFTRGKGSTSPLSVTAYDGVAAKITSPHFVGNGCWARGVDLWPWLCRLWSDDELASLLPARAPSPAVKPGLQVDAGAMSTT